MKKFLLFIFSFIFSINVFSQDTTALNLINQAISYYENDKKDSSVLVFEKIVNQKLDSDRYIFGIAYYNIPTIYFELGDLDKAKQWYGKVIESDLKDEDETGGLMEPHANYKHKSALQLSQLYYNEGDYEESFNWLEKADNVYRYWGFEGSATSISKKKARILFSKAEILQKIGKQDQAIKLIINELLHADNLESFFHASEEILFEIINRKKFKKEYKEAIQKVELINRDKLNVFAKINLKGEEYNLHFTKDYSDFKIPHFFTKVYVDKEKKVNKKYIIDYLKKREFYKRKK